MIDCATKGNNYIGVFMFHNKKFYQVKNKVLNLFIDKFFLLHKVNITKNYKPFSKINSMLSTNYSEPYNISLHHWIKPRPI